MPNYPRRGSRLSLECSCEARVTDWALTLWGDRLYAVKVLAKGARCRIERHQTGRTLSARVRRGRSRPILYDTLNP